MMTQAEVGIQSLTASLKPLVDHFNGEQNKLRVMVVLSPTCQR